MWNTDHITTFSLLERTPDVPVYHLWHQLTADLPLLYVRLHFYNTPSGFPKYFPLNGWRTPGNNTPRDTEIGHFGHFRTQIYCRTSRGIHPEIHGIVFSLPIESTEYDRHSAGVCIFWRLPRNLKYFHIGRRFGRHFRPHSVSYLLVYCQIGRAHV